MAKLLASLLAFCLAILTSCGLYLVIWTVWTMLTPKPGEPLVWSVFGAFVLMPIITFVYYFPLLALFVGVSRVLPGLATPKIYAASAVAAFAYSEILFNLDFAGNLLFALMARNQGMKFPAACLSVVGAVAFIYWRKSLLGTNGGIE